MKEIKQRISSIIALIVIITMTGICLLVLSHKQNGSCCVVQSDGQVIKKLPLDADITERVETANGYNIIEIRNGAVFVKEADCPNQICVHAHPISKEGQIISCIPHGLIITVHTSEKEVDAVAY